MGTKEKAILRLKAEPADYTFKEAEKLLTSMGYERHNKGNSSGSRVMFVKGTHKILMHKPHPGDEMKRYAVRQLKATLEEMEEI